MSNQPHPDGVRLLPWRIPPWTIDAVLIGIVVIGFVGRPFSDRGGAFEASEWVDLVIAVALLLLRRRFPLPDLVAGIVATAVLVATVDRPTLLMPVTLVLLSTVAVRHDRRTALIAGAGTTAAFVTIVLAVLEGGEVGGAVLASFAWPAFAVAAGTTVRATRENIAAAEERARRAEQSRELEVQRRVIEERLRIARDVHDLVAHHIAVINVQSGVADHLLQSDPDAASDALGVVRSAAATVVDELGELLSLLRAADDAGVPTEPTPDLAAVDDLVASFASSGLSVQHRTSGSPRSLTASAELAAYRVVQEALTNAHKYGDGTASVALGYDDAGLEIVVSNPHRRSDGSGSGFGLLGMRERIEAVGGTLDSGLTDGGRAFEIVARIPGKERR